MARYLNIAESTHVPTGATKPELQPTTSYDELRAEKAAAEPEEQLSLMTAVRRRPRVVGYSLALTSTIILWGYDMVIVGNVSAMPASQWVAELGT